MSTPSEEHESTEPWFEVVRAKVGAIRYGSVQITVHDGRVTQVEAIEKTRIGAEQSASPARLAKPLKKP